MLHNLMHRLLGDALPCYVLSRNPLVLVSYWQDFHQRRDLFIDACKEYEGNIYVLAMLGWHRETAERADALRDEVAQLRHADSRFEAIILTNCPREQSLLAARRLRAVFCHQNAFLDERRYRVDMRIRKSHDALYVARITPFKRHMLASELSSLRLIGSWNEAERAYRDEVMLRLPQASWQENVRAPFMYREMNRVRTGLCLSAEEGAMFVSAEYLLCGLPVVSTPNLGGRDQLFPPDFALTVEPSPRAIADGVEQQIDQGHDPRAIREATLALMRPHRDALVDLLQSIYDVECIDRDARMEWPTLFRHKMGIRCRVPLTVRQRRSLFRIKPLIDASHMV